MRRLLILRLAGGVVIVDLGDADGDRFRCRAARTDRHGQQERKQDRL
jgi:hypothetical protein